jgi:two-component system, LuxR family, response regulator FixJ
MCPDPTVFVVDDDPAALESLRWMIEQADFPVKAFQSGRDFLAVCPPEQSGCLVLDVRMPDFDGLALQRAMRERQIRLPIIFITAYGDVPTCARAFRGGAANFLEKPVDDKVLLEHIGRIMAAAQRNVQGDDATNYGARLSLLTPTESEVLEALAQGKSIKEIASARDVSVQTVWRHQTNIFRKVGVENQLELVRVATEWLLKRQKSPTGET